MGHFSFEKITPVNGFDSSDPQNARQNNYAWSMAEYGDYIYVGTGRNAVYLALKSKGIDPFPEITPEAPDHSAEIWRYRKGGRAKEWELVYKAPAEWLVYGFRKMIVYTDPFGRTALVAGGISLSNDEAFVFCSYDGVTWERIPDALEKGFNVRTMIEYNGSLYSGANNAETYGDTSYLAVTTSLDDGFKQLPIPQGEGMPKGEIMSMAVFNGYLYIGTALGEGFGVWKTSAPQLGEWIQVVDKGAGDALNEWAMTMEVFEDHLYVGTAITYGLMSVDEEKGFVPMKGFDLIRIDENDQWSIVIGGKPIAPTNPITGRRGESEYPSGLGSMFNVYCWQLQSHQGKLWLTTFDSAMIYRDLISYLIEEGVFEGLGEIEIGKLTDQKIWELLRIYLKSLMKEDYYWDRWLISFLSSLPRYPREFGFDCFVSEDGLCFHAVDREGFGNPHNYGIRTLLSGSDKTLYIGTANPYEGAEVWTCTHKHRCDDCCCG